MWDLCTIKGLKMVPGLRRDDAGVGCGLRCSMWDLCNDQRLQNGSATRFGIDLVDVRLLTSPPPLSSSPSVKLQGFPYLLNQLSQHAQLIT